MKIEQAKELLKKVDEYTDFVSFFFEEDASTLEAVPLFELVYKSEDEYTDNAAAALYDVRGSCFNRYMKLEDGYLEYPF